MKALEKIQQYKPTPPNQWRGIESAPRDGTEVDLWGWIPYDMTEFRLPDCKFENGEWFYFRNGEYFPVAIIDYTPTHFMPLPPPPEGECGAD
jgi:hypothetical protein